MMDLAQGYTNLWMNYNINKLNLWTGRDIRTGYLNHDISGLPGIDSIHDLNQMSWKSYTVYFQIKDVNQIEWGSNTNS